MPNFKLTGYSKNVFTKDETEEKTIYFKNEPTILFYEHEKTRARIHARPHD